MGSLRGAQRGPKIDLKSTLAAQGRPQAPWRPQGAFWGPFWGNFGPAGGVISEPSGNEFSALQESFFQAVLGLSSAVLGLGSAVFGFSSGFLGFSSGFLGFSLG